MGGRITIDSATLMNKGFEAIEAHHLFGVPYGRIAVVVHPQSIVHSLIDLNDGATLAHLGLPDMRVPISYALHYPERADVEVPRLDLAAAGELTFEEPDLETFACLRLALEAGGRAGPPPASSTPPTRSPSPPSSRGRSASQRSPRRSSGFWERCPPAPSPISRTSSRSTPRPAAAPNARRGAGARMSWVWIFLGFSALIILHEAGHFFAAKATGMRVEKFFLFFGPKLFSRKRGETEYGIASIPAGGYVKISGMNPDDVLPEGEEHRGYYEMPVWKRIVVIGAGPAVNIVLAFAILSAVLYFNAEKQATRPWGDQGRRPGSEGAEAGRQAALRRRHVVPRAPLKKPAGKLRQAGLHP